MEANIFNIQKFSLHDGPGIRTSIFFYGCNLRCKWCANPECFTPNNQVAKIQRWNHIDLLHEVLKDKCFYDKSGGGVTLTGGECLLQHVFIIDFCKELRKNNIHIAIETAGNIDDYIFKKIINLVDFIFFDCKHYSDEVHKKGTGTSNVRILSNLSYLAKHSDNYCVRIPIIPQFNDTLSDAYQFCALFEELGVKQVELLPFHQYGENKYNQLEVAYLYEGTKQLHPEMIADYKDIFFKKNLIYNTTSK